MKIQIVRIMAMKKLLAVLLVGAMTLGQTACNGPEVESIIADIGQTVISVLGIEGKLTSANQAEANALATTAENDYAAYINAPLSEKQTALQKFQTSWGLFLNLVQPVLADAGANPILSEVVQLCLSQVSAVTAIIAQSSAMTSDNPADYVLAMRVGTAAQAAGAKSEKDYRDAVNAKLARFGGKYKLKGPAHRKAGKVAGKVKFWKW